MEHLKALTTQQLVIAACGALLVGSVMLSHENRLSYAMFALSVLCGIGAFAKAKDR